jgi:outer membrane protein insertion porin family
MMRFLFILGFALSIAPMFGQNPILVDRIEVIPATESEDIRALLPFEEGEPFEPRWTLLTEKLLLATDHYERVVVRWDESARVFSVDVKRRLTFKEIVWEGDRVYSSGDIERTCIAFNEGVFLTQERLSQITRCITGELNERGHLDASIVISEDDQVLRVQAILGAVYTVGDLSIEGLTGYQERDYIRRLLTRPGMPFRPNITRSDRAILQSGLISDGYYFVEAFQPTLQIDSAEHRVNVQWRVDLGQKFLVSFLGEYTSRKVLEEMIERNEPFSRWFVDELQDGILSDLRRQGFLDADVLVKRENQNGVEVIKFLTLRGKRYRTTKPDFVGVNESAALEELFREFSELKSGKPFNRELYLDLVQEDFGNLLYQSGYLDVQIRGVDFVVDRDGGLVRPIIYMSEGDQYFIQQVSWKGADPVVQKTESWGDLKYVLRERIPFREQAVEEARSALKSELISIGYLDADVKLVFQKALGRIDVEVQIILGPLYRVGMLMVRGAQRTRQSVLLREADLSIGDVFTEESVRDSVANILRLGIARSVDIRVIDKDPSLGLAYVMIDILEAARFRVEVGPGFGTLDGVRGVFKGTYSNIGGRARRINFFAKANRKLESSKVLADVLDPREVPFIQRRLTVEYFEPGILGLPFDLRLIFTNLKQQYRLFSLFQNGFESALEYRINRRISFITSYSLEYVDPFNVAVGANTPIGDERARTLASLNQTVFTTFVDDEFNPSRGTRSRLVGRLYQREFGGDEDFWQTTLKQDFYFPIWRPRKGLGLGFSTSANTGFTGAIGPTQQVPVEKRFYVGGENSVRGFNDQGINPRSAGNPGEYDVGGVSFFYFQTEFHVPLLSGVDFLAFFDGGNVYSTLADYQPWDLRYGAGPGLRWNTPVGPLKIGYGFNLARRVINGEREPVGAFYFGVGSL